jgi:hypothetical protein
VSIVVHYQCLNSCSPHSRLWKRKPLSSSIRPVGGALGAPPPPPPPQLKSSPNVHSQVHIVLINLIKESLVISPKHQSSRDWLMVDYTI